jgi:hypothetical protein
MCSAEVTVGVPAGHDFGKPRYLLAPALEDRSGFREHLEPIGWVEHDLLTVVG